ncbi:RICIN domain-containing protein [Streptomyces sp. B21-083]|uniref:RICIN domain-containing protein n=1 Tax=Streptomyces sp. B21-083 TaxID=3039410 RepID=UPI002FF2779C
MNRPTARKTATRLTAMAAASLSVLAFASPASAGVRTVQPRSVTYYQFKNYYTGKCLDVGGQANGSVVQQYTCNGTVNQQWSLRSTGGGYFQLVVASSGRCMEVVNSDQSNNAVVQIVDCNGGYNQQWATQTSTHAGWPRLAARHSGKCLQPLNENTGDRTQQVQFDCYTAWSQEWNQS